MRWSRPASAGARTSDPARRPGPSRAQPGAPRSSASRRSAIAASREPPTGKPPPASDTAGSSRRSRGSRANSACASSSAATKPGTATEPGPSSTRDGSTAEPAAPLPLTAVTSPWGERTSMKASPPRPQDSGMTTASTAAAASAALTAPPPSLKVAMPAPAASGWPQATTPRGPRRSGRGRRLGTGGSLPALPDPERDGVRPLRQGLLDAALLLGTAEHDPGAATADLCAHGPAACALGAHEERPRAGGGPAHAPGGVQPAALRPGLAGHGHADHLYAELIGGGGAAQRPGPEARGVDAVVAGRVHAAARIGATVVVGVGPAVGEWAPVERVRHPVVVDVRIAGVAEAVVVGVRLVGVRQALAVVEIVDHAVLVGIVVTEPDHAVVPGVGDVQQRARRQRRARRVVELAGAATGLAESVELAATLRHGRELDEPAVSGVDHDQAVDGVPHQSRRALQRTAPDRPDVEAARV